MVQLFDRVTIGARVIQNRRVIPPSFIRLETRKHLDSPSGKHFGREEELGGGALCDRYGRQGGLFSYERGLREGEGDGWTRWWPIHPGEFDYFNGSLRNERKKGMGYIVQHRVWVWFCVTFPFHCMPYHIRVPRYWASQLVCVRRVVKLFLSWISSSVDRLRVMGGRGRLGWIRQGRTNQWCYSLAFAPYNQTHRLPPFLVPSSLLM